MELKTYRKYLAIGLAAIVMALALAIVATSEREEEVSEFKSVKLLKGYYASPLHIIFGLGITEEAASISLSIKSWCSGILNATLYGISLSGSSEFNYTIHSIEPYGETTMSPNSLLDYLTIRSSFEEECTIDLYLSYERHTLKYGSLSILSIAALVIGSALVIIALYYKLLEKSLEHELQAYARMET